MTIDTQRLRELAQKSEMTAENRDDYPANYARFIAAANPATVLALLDALDDAHRNMGDFGLLADKKTSECRSLINWVNDIAEDLSIPEESVDGMSMGDAIFRLKQIEAAARNLAKVKGRHNSEIAMNQLLEALK